MLSGPPGAQVSTAQNVPHPSWDSAPAPALAHGLRKQSITSYAPKGFLTQVFYFYSFSRSSTSGTWGSSCPLLQWSPQGLCPAVSGWVIHNSSLLLMSSSFSLYTSSDFSHGSSGFSCRRQNQSTMRLRSKPAPLAPKGHRVHIQLDMDANSLSSF